MNPCNLRIYQKKDEIIVSGINRLNKLFLTQNLALLYDLEASEVLRGVFPDPGRNPSHDRRSQQYSPRLKS